MPEAKDGTKFHSFGRAALHDSMSKDSKATGTVDRGKAESGEGHEHTMAEEHVHPPDSKESIHDVVSEHGPAHTIHSHHDHEGGSHHVTSFHGEHHHGHAEGSGFTHHSTHGTKEEAHSHMGHALGIGTEHEEHESPEFEAGEHEGAMESKIPGMM